MTKHFGDDMCLKCAAHASRDRERFKLLATKFRTKKLPSCGVLTSVESNGKKLVYTWMSQEVSKWLVSWL